MPNPIKLILITCLAILMSSCASHPPSKGATGMSGAKGTFAFTPSDWKKDQKTWWKDSDGVAPGVAGCHIGTDGKGKTNGRVFGEACLANGLLVESNPEAGKVHSHGNDIGHPDTFDCNSRCIGKGSADGGQCVAVEGPAPCKASARCECK